jgi:hypothetical protein
MGTKNNPSNWDCYANAELDEPMFILLARDVTAQYLVAAWVALQCGEVEDARKMMDAAAKELSRTEKPTKERTDPKMVEANQCAYTMRTWLLGKKIEELEGRNRDNVRNL